MTCINILVYQHKHVNTDGFKMQAFLIKDLWQWYKHLDEVQESQLLYFQYDFGMYKPYVPAPFYKGNITLTFKVYWKYQLTGKKSIF